MLPVLAGFPEFGFQAAARRGGPGPQGRQGPFQFLHLFCEPVEFLGQVADGQRPAPASVGPAHFQGGLRGRQGQDEVEVVAPGGGFITHRPPVGLNDVL